MLQILAQTLASNHVSDRFKTDLLKQKIAEIKNRTRGGFEVVLVLDVDNCLYHSGAETNYEHIIDKNIISFFQNKFSLDENQAGTLQKRLQEAGSGYTVAGLKRVFDDNPQAIEVLLSVNVEAKKALLSKENILDLGSNPDFNTSADYKPPQDLLDDYIKHVWDIEPSADNMKFDPKLAQQLSKLKESGVKLVAHSNSAVCGVTRVLEYVLGENQDIIEQDLIFGIDSFGFQPKPWESSYKSLFSALKERGIGGENALKLFIDDGLKNVIAAGNFYDFTVIRANSKFRVGKTKAIEAAFAEGNQKILGITADTVEGLTETLNQLAEILAKEKGQSHIKQAHELKPAKLDAKVPSAEGK